MTSTFKTYLQLLGIFWQTAIAAELEYRLNFLLSSFSSLANLTGSIFSLFLFYRTGYSFAGWNWEEALVVLGMFTLLQGFSATLLIPNLNRIVQYVEKGTLDFVLLKPISSQFWLSTRIFSPWGIPDLFFGLLLIFYSANRLKVDLAHIFFSLVMLFLGMIILYSIWFILGATSIWFVKIYNVTEVLRGLLEAGRYPIIAYPAAYRVFFTFIIPIAFLTTIPAEAMLDKTDLSWILGAGLLAIILLILSHLFWQFALRFYTSASS